MMSRKHSGFSLRNTILAGLAVLFAAGPLFGVCFMGQFLLASATYQQEGLHNALMALMRPIYFGLLALVGSAVHRRLQERR